MKQSIADWPEDRRLRHFQVRARLRYAEASKPDFMVTATPGAGKTIMALRIAHDLLTEGVVRQVVVVVPTRHLCEQWAAAAASAGLMLDPDWEVSWIGDDFHGIVMTYQMCAARCDVLRRVLSRDPTLVILDEPHHMADEKTWGRMAAIAFEGATRRLGLSGTLFRSDNHRIPFVRYEEGCSVPDFAYGYGEALLDGHCRSVVFPQYDASASWLRNGTQYNGRLSDDVDDQQHADAIRTALREGAFLPDLLREADAKLSEVRGAGDPDAGGMVFSMEIQDATRVASELRRIAGADQVAIVHSDEPEAARTIAEFRRDGRRWLVSVKMVSEGVDIPRLRVGVYATNVTAELFFRQAVGRFVRVRREVEVDQTAYIYLPSDTRLEELARQIKVEREHAIDQLVARLTSDLVAGDLGAQMPLNLMTPLASSGAEFAHAVFDSDAYSAAEIARARAAKDNLHMIDSAEKIAALLRSVAPIDAAPVVVHATTERADLQRGDLRQQNDLLVRRLAGMDLGEFGDACRRLNTDANRAVNISSVREATLEQLERRRQVLLARLADRQRDH